MSLTLRLYAHMLLYHDDCPKSCEKIDIASGTCTACVVAKAHTLRTRPSPADRGEEQLPGHNFKMLHWREER